MNNLREYLHIAIYIYIYIYISFIIVRCKTIVLNLIPNMSFRKLLTLFYFIFMYTILYVFTKREDGAFVRNIIS